MRRRGQGGLGKWILDCPQQLQVRILMIFGESTSLEGNNVEKKNFVFRKKDKNWLSLSLSYPHPFSGWWSSSFNLLSAERILNSLGGSLHN